MYQALYRKYRPNNFDEVVGQEVIIKTLKNSIINNKINHAYLFTGPRGTGKTSIAKILAKTVNCLSIVDGEPCDKCVNCTQFNNKQMIDIIEIDAATNNGIDEIRDLRSKTVLVPSIGKYKVYIIDEVHMLSQGAFNGLLKTLEEPPQHIIFILATTEPYKIPATILSRCQRFDFKKIASNKIAKSLENIAKKENIDIDKEAIDELAILSDGGMRDAISMLDQVIAYSNDKITVDDVHEINGTITKVELEQFITSIIDKDLITTLNKLDKYDNDGKDLKKLIEEIVIFLKNVLLYKTVPNYFLGNKINIETYSKLSKNIQTSRLIELISSFNTLTNDVKYINDPKINLELLIIGLMDEQEKNYLQEESGNNKEIDISKEKTTIEKKEEVIEIKSNETKKEKIKINTIKKANDSFEKLKELRISNALAKLDKKVITETKKIIDNSREYILNAEFGDYMSLILDGTLKAASDEYLVFMYETDRMSDFFNESILNLEKLINEISKKEYKLISVSKEEWNNIKTNYNNKLKKYEYKEEEDSTEILTKKEEDKLTDFFGDIVEYE